MNKRDFNEKEEELKNAIKKKISINWTGGSHGILAGSMRIQLG